MKHIIIIILSLIVGFGIGYHTTLYSLCIELADDMYYVTNQFDMVWMYE